MALFLDISFLFTLLIYLHFKLYFFFTSLNSIFNFYFLGFAGLVGRDFSFMGNFCGRHAKLAHVSSTNFPGSTNSHSKSKLDASTTHSHSKTKQDSTSSKQPTNLRSLSQSLVTSKFDTSVSKNLKSFSFSDLKNATKNFRSESLIGEGGFGFVYKGWIDENTFAPTKPGTGIVVAIKKLKQESFQGHKEWLAEVNYLSQLRHENVVKLIGYCSDSENRILVYEFLQKGSLENHLFRKGTQPIAWATRMTIAIDVARGLSFLHNLNANVIYRDIKAANILLDSDFKAKLSDFGLARDGPTGDKTHVSTRVVGTQGYAAPEYVSTGRLTPKTDVYGFGVVLLELLSGKRAVNEERAGFSDETLVTWAKPFLTDSRRVLRVMDTRLGGQYSKKEAQAAGALALQCLDTDPWNRPPMIDVLSTLERLHTSNTTPRTPEYGTERHGIKHSRHPQIKKAANTNKL